MNHQSRFMALLAICCASIFWGFSFISIKITVAVIPPMTSALLRFLIASAVLVSVLKIVEPKSRLQRADMWRMALSGLFGITAYYYFQNTGVKLTTASAASMILAAIPILTIVGERLVFKAKMSFLKITSVILSIGGVYLIVAFSQQETSDSILGDLFMLGASVAWVVYCLLTRPLSEAYSHLAIITYQTLFGTLALIPLVFFESWDWQAVDSTIVFHLIYLGLICSALANYLYLYAMRILGISSVSLFINLIPVISVLAGCTILQEPVGSLQIMGGAVILFSVYLANRN